MTKIKSEDIELSKKLLDSYGIKWIQAIGEADKLCAALVIKRKVFAVLSEDMDLFAYGSLNVIKYLSLMTHNCVIYNYKKILNKLNMTSNEFKLLCTLSGNDYFKNDKNIFYYYKLHEKYFKRKKNSKDLSWFEWLKINNHFDNLELNEIKKTYNLYLINVNELSQYKYFIIKNNGYDKKELLNILKTERFI